MAHSRFRRSGSQRRTDWLGGPSGVLTSITASGAQGFALSSAATIAGSTIVRIRGYLQFLLTAAGAAADGFTGAFGIGKSTGEAITIGITALPTPLADAAWDGWMYHTFFSIRAFTGTLSDQNNVGQTFNMHIDSKAMRKINPEDALFAVVEVTEIGVSSMAGSLDSRILVKLP